MAGSLLPEPKQQFLNDIGDPLFGGQVFTYEAGTLTPKSTYQDQELTIANTNPVIANARGEVVMYGSGVYRIILKDLFGSVIWDRDNIETPDFAGAAFTLSLSSGSGSGLVGWMQSGVGAILRTVLAKLREIVSPTDFSTTQGAVDSCIATGRVLELPTGAINVSETINLNGTGNVAAPNQQRPGLLGLRGKGRFSTSVFTATSALSSVVSGLNMSGVHYSNFSVDGAGICTGGLDLSWVGGSQDNPTLAPSNQNILENIMVQGCTLGGITLNQFHDSKISGVWVRGVDAEGYAISLRGPGGQMAMDNVWCSTGIFVLSCQNAAIVNCGFFGGVQLVDSGFNNIDWTGVHFYPRASNGVVVSNDATGNATRANNFSGCYVNDCTYFTNGLWHEGATFTACQFNAWAGFADPVNFTPAGGSGQLPLFTFINCSFGGPTPVDVPGKYRVRVLGCKNSVGSIIDDYGNFTNTGTFNSIGSGQMLGQTASFSGKSLVTPPTNWLDIPISRGTFLLTVVSINSAGGAAGIRTHTTYQIAILDIDNFIATQLATGTGSGGGMSFTVTSPSANSIRITNTSVNNANIYASVVGAFAG